MYDGGMPKTERGPCVAGNQFGWPCGCYSWRPTDDDPRREQFCACGHHIADHPFKRCDELEAGG